MKLSAREADVILPMPMTGLEAWMAWRTAAAFSPGQGQGRRHPHAAFPHAGRHVEGVDVLPGQDACCGHAVFQSQASAGGFRHTEAQDDGEVRSDSRPDGPDGLHGEADAILQAASVAVLPGIGEGRKELLGQIAVARMQLHGVEACFLGPQGRAGIVTQDPVDIFLPHGAGLVIAETGHRGRKERQAGHGPGGLSAGMTQLDAAWTDSTRRLRPGSRPSSSIPS